LEKGAPRAGGKPVRGQARSKSGGRVGEHRGAAVFGGRAAKDGIDWLKKSPGSAAEGAPELDRPEGATAVEPPVRVGGVSRSVLYAPRREQAPSAQDVELLALIDAEYTRHPFHDSCRMVHHLRDLGHRVNRKRVQRLMRILGLSGMVSGPHTSRPILTTKVYPYLLRGVEIDYPDQI
jgi:hypothetical protein